jgi:hypothetical protein
MAEPAKQTVIAAAVQIAAAMVVVPTAIPTAIPVPMLTQPVVAGAALV